MKYKRTLPRELRQWFSEQMAQGDEVPTTDKWQTLCGYTDRDIAEFRCKHRKFADAYDFCRKITYGILIDGALHKRFDASLVRFLLNTTYGFSEKEAVAEGDGGPFEVTVSVVTPEDTAASGEFSSTTDAVEEAP